MKVYKKLLFFTADTFNETRVDEFLSGWFIIHDNLDLDNFDPMKFFFVHRGSQNIVYIREGGGGACHKICESGKHVFLFYFGI